MVWSDGSSLQFGLDRVGLVRAVSVDIRGRLSGSRDIGKSQRDKYSPRWLDLIKAKYSPKWLDLIKSKCFYIFIVNDQDP